MKQSKYEEHIEDLLALQLLKPLLIPYGYLPITNSALRPHSLVHVSNDILINCRKTILEFGCGISTLIFGMLSKLNALKLSIVSIDHDNDWIQIVKSNIEKYELQEYITLIYAPLLPYGCVKIPDISWYDVKHIENLLPADFGPIDLILIDGPPAYKKSIKYSRYPALKFVHNSNRLNNDRFSIYLDDTNRSGEKKIIKLWEKEYNLKFKYLNNSFCFASRGKLFNISL